MNKGTLELKKLLETFRTMSTDEYLELYELAKTKTSGFQINIDDEEIEITYSFNEHTPNDKSLLAKCPDSKNVTLIEDDSLSFINPEAA